MSEWPCLPCRKLTLLPLSHAAWNPLKPIRGLRISLTKGVVSAYQLQANAVWPRLLWMGVEWQRQGMLRWQAASFIQLSRGKTTQAAEKEPSSLDGPDWDSISIVKCNWLWKACLALSVFWSGWVWTVGCPGSQFMCAGFQMLPVYILTLWGFRLTLCLCIT